MKTILSFAFLALHTAALATSTNSTPLNCHDLMLDVPVTATNYKLDVIRVNNNIEAIEFALDIDRWTAPNTTELIIGEVNITDTFSIYAQLCLPDPGKDKHIVQILSHGGVFDHRYWDAEVDPAQYSWVFAAVNAGYTILNYDRLGNGLSQKADAYDVVQGPLEVELLQVLTKMVRDGSLLSNSVPGYTSSPQLHLPAFNKIVHVGHSFGSQITQAFLVKYGNQSTGAILTGFTFPTHTGLFEASAFGLEYAATNNPELFGDLGSGYLVPATVSNLQNLFFHRFNESDPTGFSNEALAYGESIKQPITIGEGISTRGLLSEAYAADFAGPIQHVLGEFDFLVCDGDCRGDFDPANNLKVYPNATTIETYVRPGSGHGLPLHRNASAGFAISLDFLERHGL